ncbi:hypothetical protein ACJJJB_10265 [Microbulbifer sp. ANSA001]|uniref:hypothetical protein n=1 Tax=Microbulbifer sp. ANSA001 TaxID=3243358 RepID=UPI004040F117
MKALTSIAVAMLVAFSGNTFADNNTAILFQAGSNNMVVTTQDPSTHNNLIVQVQVGDSNDSEASQALGARKPPPLK